MASPHAPTDRSSRERGRGTELWLLRAGAPEQLEELWLAFATTPLTLVLSGPAAPETAWATELARRLSARLLCSAELRGRGGASPAAAALERAWPALLDSLSTGHPRVLAVLELDILRGIVARALSMPLARSRALRVDPGRLVLLRDDPIGFVLRRANVAAPESSSGTPLPSGRAGSEGARTGGAA